MQNRNRSRNSATHAIYDFEHSSYTTASVTTASVTTAGLDIVLLRYPVLICQNNTIITGYQRQSAKLTLWQIRGEKAHNM